MHKCQHSLSLASMLAKRMETGSQASSQRRNASEIERTYFTVTVSSYSYSTSCTSSSTSGSSKMVSSTLLRWHRMYFPACAQNEPLPLSCVHCGHVLKDLHAILLAKRIPPRTFYLTVNLLVGTCVLRQLKMIHALTMALPSLARRNSAVCLYRASDLQPRDQSTRSHW